MIMTPSIPEDGGITESLLGRFLAGCPTTPRHPGLEDVKGQIGVQLTIALVVIKEIIVWILVPL